MTILFWLILCLVLYPYVGYPLIVALLSLGKRKVANPIPDTQDVPEITLFITAYNEEAVVHQKMANSLQLDYPKEKLKIVWLTDGSADQTNALLAEYPEATVYYEPGRKGKIHAMNRGVQFVQSELIVFTDANTILGKDTLWAMLRQFQNPQVACVAGEKRVETASQEKAAAAGESIYWRYESWLKEKDALLGSCIGAAGELFAIRRNLYQEVPENALLDDFMISMRLAMKGYKVAYDPQAYASEKSSLNVAEEMKRKYRIAAGSVQSMLWLLPLFNCFKYKFLSFQYISHKVFRWAVVPFLLPWLAVVNFYVYMNGAGLCYTFFGLGQILFYILVILGYFLRNKKVNFSFVFIPYYFFLANWAMYVGLVRFVKKKQSVNWERAARKV